jgi:predicted transcriptional regulator
MSITIRFRPETVAQLRILARREHRSINGTVEEAVERYLRARHVATPEQGGEDDR